ncbi:hypothetical protein U1Q18_026107, partial [Sarracenia purpurea var. burkii]
SPKQGLEADTESLESRGRLVRKKSQRKFEAPIPWLDDTVTFPKSRHGTLQRNEDHTFSEEDRVISGIDGNAPDWYSLEDSQNDRDYTGFTRLPQPAPTTHIWQPGQTIPIPHNRNFHRASPTQARN